MSRPTHAATTGVVVTRGGTRFALQDVPTVSADVMQRAMSLLVDMGHGLALLNGLTATQLARFDDALHSTFAENPSTAVLVAVRFRALLDVFQGRRLQRLLLNTGWPLLAVAADIAGNERLNANIGFNGQRLLMRCDHDLARRHCENPALAPTRSMPSRHPALQAAA